MRARLASFGSALGGLGLLFAAAPGLSACSGSDDDGPKPPYELTEARRDTFAKEIESALVPLEVPGVAYALVAHGQVVESRAFGFRNLERSQPVTPDTLFRVGSITKAMSSAMLASHVDEGAFTWDTLAKGIDPSFQLTDAALTTSVTVAELLGMGTGLAAPPPFWWEYQTPEDVMRTVSALPASAKRGAFVYNNEGYATGVYLGLSAGGEQRPLLEAYASELEARVFTPIGMSPAAVADDPALVGDDYASSYMLSLVDKLSFEQETPPFALQGLAAAGAVVTNVNQLAKFLITEMQHGLAPNGTRVASVESITRTQTAQTKWSGGGYGMGWVVDQELAIPILWHDGAVDGFRSLMLSLPEDDVGMVVLTNGLNGNRLCAIARAALLRAVHGKALLSASLVENQYNSDRATLATTAKGLNADFVADAYMPYLGAYEHSVSLALHDDGTLWVEAPGVEGRLLEASTVTAPGVLAVGNGQFVGNLLQFVGNDAGDARLEFLSDSTLQPVTVLHKLPM